MIHCFFDLIPLFQMYAPFQVDVIENNVLTMSYEFLPDTSKISYVCVDCVADSQDFSENFVNNSMLSKLILL